MAVLAWPLERNEIRRGIKNNAFGMVRNGGTRAHQGWDLYAIPGTMCYAIADGMIDVPAPNPFLGSYLLLEFQHNGQTLYAAYCHLSAVLARHKEHVKRGQLVALAGNSGNAATMSGDDQHLHFEIRTIKHAGLGLGGRLDPATLYGAAPMGWTFFEGHGQKPRTAGVPGLKVPGVTIRENVR